MDKYAAEKIASEYYNLGIELAFENAGLGMSKTASKGRNLAKMLGIGAGGAGLGAAAMKMMTPAQESLSAMLAKLSPSELAKVMGETGGKRLGMLDDVTSKMVRNADMANPDVYERLAMTTQALKPSALAETKIPGILGAESQSLSDIGSMYADRLQAFKPSNLFDSTTLDALGMMGKDYGQAAKLTLQDLKGAMGDGLGSLRETIGDGMDTLRGSIDPHHNIPLF
jgi:hypothetical protein